MFDKDTMKRDLEIMQEKYDEKQQIPMLISMMKNVFEQGRFFERGYKQGYLDESGNNSYGGPSLGGFHGDY
ncbi:hypothetical protein FACS1894110_01970 [Spirochaetia bacterium]|nr:hypothetical protein FACS1894110_01970 [Spirochaetia bacterium]